MWLKLILIGLFVLMAVDGYQQGLHERQSKDVIPAPFYDQ